jgi:hypothetical protein
MNWLRGIFNRDKSGNEADGSILEAKRDAQTLKLELEDRERTISALRNELDHHRSSDLDAREAGAQLQIERLLSDAATPVAQLVTQAHLIETEGKDVQARDVLAAAQRLIRCLEGAGMALEGCVGDTVAFDPNRHESLDSNKSIVRGEPVTIRLVGISHKGKIIRKAGVKPCQDV